jgi:hypothetical protein
MQNNHCNPFAQTISLSVSRSLSPFIPGDRGAVSLRQFTDSQLICRLLKTDHTKVPLLCPFCWLTRFLPAVGAVSPALNFAVVATDFAVIG